MKPLFSFISKSIIVSGFMLTVISFSALSQTQRQGKSNNGNEEMTNGSDTSKSLKRSKSRLYDHDMLESEMRRLDVEMKKLDGEMKKIDATLNKEVLKEVSTEKLQAQLNEALAKIDWERMESEMQENLTNLDQPNPVELKKQMEKLKVDLQKQKMNIKLNAAKVDTRKIRANAEKAIKNAKESISKAREEIKNARDFTNALEKDGLIDKSKPYKIEVKDGELYLNGQKQSKEVSEKYRQYYKKDSFSIDTNDNSTPI